MIVINKISNENRKKFKQRLFSTLFIVGYLIVYFILAILSDKVYFWSPFIDSIITKKVIGGILTFLQVPLILIASYEISKNFISDSKKMIVTTSVMMLISTLSPLICLYLYHFEIISSIESKKLYKEAFLPLMIFVVFLGLIVLFFGLSFYKKLNFKNITFTFIVYILINSFFIGSIYLTFIKGWVTYLFMLLIVFLSDTFAYIGGMFFGKTKLSTKYSPNKTVEGLLFGLAISSMIILLLIFGLSYVPRDQTNDQRNILENLFGGTFKKSSLIFDPQYFLWWIAIAIVFIGLSLVSTLGDMLYSVFKRAKEIKDYSNLLPGHGGLLDRIDSHSLVIFVVFSITISTEVVKSFLKI